MSGLSNQSNRTSGCIRFYSLGVWPYDGLGEKHIELPNNVPIFAALHAADMMCGRVEPPVE